MTPSADWDRDIRRWGVATMQAAKRAMIEAWARTLFTPYAAGFIELRCFMKPGVADYRPPQQYWFDLKRVLADPRDMDLLVKVALRAESYGFDVYAGALPRAARSGTRADVAEMAFIWADIDFKTVPADEAQARLRQMRGDQAPAIVVETGHGYHGYWPIAKEQVTAFGAARAEARLRGWQASLFPSHGMRSRIDLTVDLPRILRVPGTTNYKEPSDPRSVRLILPRPSPPPSPLPRCA